MKCYCLICPLIAKESKCFYTVLSSTCSYLGLIVWVSSDSSCACMSPPPPLTSPAVPSRSIPSSSGMPVNGDVQGRLARYSLAYPQQWILPEAEYEWVCQSRPSVRKIIITLAESIQKSHTIDALGIYLLFEPKFTIQVSLFYLKIYYRWVLK